ncbi:MAG: hypothetical protein FWD23_19050 [Oscillospiraceae bacterium]|nr:hypothetical protein [Oscillospiraceae bacterium]
MNIAGKNIFNDIVNCGLCENHKPFHFEMGRQKIMLISFAPTYETIHRPLYFIQLFRKLCLALFGDVMPSEKFIREFYDPAGNIYWTHFQKCFKRNAEKGSVSCEPLLKKEIEALDPEIIIILGGETISRLTSERHAYIAAKPDGTPRKVYTTDLPKKESAENFEEIRRAIAPYIGWVKVECEDLDFDGVNFMDLEYASIAFLNEIKKTAVPETNRFENEWIDGIILPNIRAYNLVLQIFIFIESNIKIQLENRAVPPDNIDTRWFSPFEELLTRGLRNDTFAAREQRQAVRLLMEDIDSLHVLRNIIAHKNGVIDERNGEKNLRNIAKLKRLKGVYIYGGNSVFVSEDGIAHILKICDTFKKKYISCFGE